MHAPLGDYLAVKMCDFFEIPRVLGDYRTRASGCGYILVVGDKAAVFSGESFLIHTIFFLLTVNVSISYNIVAAEIVY